MAADKLLFHTLMTSAAFPWPALLAIGRFAPGVCMPDDKAAIVAFLRDRWHYPLFAEPIDGSLSVISADDYDPTTDRVLLHGSEPVTPAAPAKATAGRKAGFIIQLRLRQRKRPVRLV